jgi:alpha-galactosidase
MTACGLAATTPSSRELAKTPPMGWNDWAHYQCGYTAQTIVDNARALVRTGLAAAGYATVTIDDCWMQKDRDSKGDLQADPQRFPHGMQPVSQAVHQLGLKFGIYEDAGSSTCAGGAGSGEVKGGGRNYFDQDARLFASWGVDYLKLDACDVYVPPGSSREAAYRKAYAEESAALKKVDRPIVFSESAPAYFQGRAPWYDVLSWVRDYGQLWREGTDMANFSTNDPDHPRFTSVLWNYSYNLPLGRFQRPGNWNDPDFIIGGDRGLSLAETRSQLALWSMMSAPLILSSDIGQLDARALAILGNKAVIEVDQDRLGRMATLIRRNAEMDLLLKPLSDGDFAVAVLNRGNAPLGVQVAPAELGFTSKECRLDARDLWSGARQAGVAALDATVASHDTAIWRIHASASCGAPERVGAIVVVSPAASEATTHYTRCLTAEGKLGQCLGTPAEVWTVTRTGALRAEGKCLTAAGGQLSMTACDGNSAQRWRYTLTGTLISDSGHACLSSGGGQNGSLSLETCGPDKLEQIWSLPN